MPLLLISVLLLLSLLCPLCIPPVLCRAELPALPDTPVQQNIRITFDVEQAKMAGESTITLPPGGALKLLFGDLEQVRIMISEGKAMEDKVGQEIAPNDDNTLLLPSAALQRTLRISWQLTAPPPGYGSGNLISPEGITLTGFWHPAADQDMLFSLTADLPAGFNGITEADEIALKKDEENGIERLSAAYPHPLPGINFAAGQYTVQTRELDEVTLFTYFFAEDAELAEGYLDRAAEYIQRYEDLIGPFPFPRYAIVENRLPTGYGMPGFTLLGQAVIRLPFIKDTSLGHEILHSWFGNAVRNDDIGNWCEGLTTLLADQSYAEEKGEGVAFRKKQLLRYQAFVEQGSPTSVVDFQHGGDGQPMARKMRAVGYDKASMIFHSLRREIGDIRFFAGLMRLYEEKKYQQAGWADLERIFEEISRTDLTQFFKQWLLRNDIPDFAVEQVGMEQKEGQTVVSFHIVQQTTTPYRLRLPVFIRTRTETVQQVVTVEKADQEVSVTTDSLPVELRIDPEYDLMRTLTPAERPPVWMQFMGAEQKTAVLPDNDEETARYQPLLAYLERLGCSAVRAEKLQNSELAQGSFIFLGSSTHRRGLFGPVQASEGFTLDVRKNPLNQDQVMVLVTSASAEETTRILRKLSHYGSYSRLHFAEGQLQEKWIAPADNGIRLPLVTPPAGIPVSRIRDFSAILDDIAQSRVIYVGEIHTDFGTHLLQLQVIQALREEQEKAGRHDGLVIGMEMFPRTAQHVLDDYISGIIRTEQEFLQLSQYYAVWGYDFRLYRDIINYARAYRIPLIGLNLNREIVSTVFDNGATDALTPEQLAEVAQERDVDLPGYQERLQQVHILHKKSEKPAAEEAETGGPETEEIGKKGNFGGFLQAQSMWDETMAESIAEYLRAHPEQQMVVLAGAGHVYKDSAVPPRVARRIDVRQSVLIAGNGQQTGREKGWQADYLLFVEDAQLPPAGKIGVILQEEEAAEEQPARVKITGISPHSRAGEAGLQQDDIIFAVDSSPVSEIGDLKIALLDKKPGDTVLLNIVRKREVMEIRVELSDSSDPGMSAGMSPGHPKK